MPYITFSGTADRTLYANVRDPQSSADMIAARGEPLALGLYEPWTLLEVLASDNRNGVFLAVRPHRYSSFVVMHYHIDNRDDGFIPTSGHYYENLQAAWEYFTKLRESFESTYVAK